MWTRVLPMLLLGFLPQGDAAAQLVVPGSQPVVIMATAISCVGRPASGTTAPHCGQLAAAGRLRAQPQPLPSSSMPGWVGPAGKGALVGLGIGLGVGVLAALVAAQGCEENESRCTVVLILGGSALGAGIGAAVGAVIGKD